MGDKQTSEIQTTDKQYSYDPLKNLKNKKTRRTTTIIISASLFYWWILWVVLPFAMIYDMKKKTTIRKLFVSSIALAFGIWLIFLLILISNLKL